MKTPSPKKRVSVEFDEAHLPTLIAALDTYSRFQSGQVGMALDIVYADRNLAYEERELLEKEVRSVAFPAPPIKKYDGHGSYTDQYGNSYSEDGELEEESDEWKLKKNRPHLNHPNSSFGVGCPEMKGGTIAFEIRKVLEEYLHYQRNNGRRNPMDVSGDGMTSSYSGINPPKVLNWSPTATFKIPKKYHKHLEAFIAEKAWPDLWDLVDRAFAKNPLPRGESAQVLQEGDTWVVQVNKPSIQKTIKPEAIHENSNPL